VLFEGRDVFTLQDSELKQLRRDMQIIFQDPYSSLDPRMPVGESVAEGLKAHGMRSARQRQEAATEVLRRVGLESYHARRYPHEFSGGQRQRIGIARALAMQPKFIVCDEPVSALDVSIQAQVLNILSDLQQDFNLTYLFIAHNLSVVEHISDRVAVMYLGKIVEVTDRETLYRNPQHPYTQALMSAIPVPDPDLRRDQLVLSGDVPSPLRPPPDAGSTPRQPFDRCKIEEPPLLDLGNEHIVACHLRQLRAARGRYRLIPRVAAVRRSISLEPGNAPEGFREDPKYGGTIEPVPAQGLGAGGFHTKAESLDNLRPLVVSCSDAVIASCYSWSLWFKYPTRKSSSSCWTASSSPSN
jgi:peptide/nickel transport system ATP-binding protein/oligopeptide transport system ATP-binding protein